jgi:hypothetical protein
MRSSSLSIFSLLSFSMPGKYRLSLPPFQARTALHVLCLWSWSSNDVSGFLPSVNSVSARGLWYRFQVKKKEFFRNFMAIMLFGVVGVFISFGIITAGTYTWPCCDILSLFSSSEENPVILFVLNWLILQFLWSSKTQDWKHSLININPFEQVFNKYTGTKNEVDSFTSCGF